MEPVIHDILGAVGGWAMMVLTKRADQAAPLWQAAVAVLAEVASMAHA
jgi:hypothetical protein